LDAKIGDGCTLTYEGVEDLEYNNCHSTEQPPKAHRFCFSCGESVHWPLTCERLDKWNEKVREEIGEVVDENGDGDLNDLAQKLWIKANTRPCPSCNVNIEKNDGCNHMVR
jgi:ariadne-1